MQIVVFPPPYTLPKLLEIRARMWCKHFDPLSSEGRNYLEQKDQEQEIASSLKFATLLLYKGNCPQENIRI